VEVEMGEAVEEKEGEREAYSALLLSYLFMLEGKRER
jgi:hypothetical protein